MCLSYLKNSCIHYTYVVLYISNKVLLSWFWKQFKALLSATTKRTKCYASRGFTVCKTYSTSTTETLDSVPTYNEIAVVNGLKTVYWRIPCLQLWTSSLQQHTELHFKYFTLIKIITQSLSLNMR